ncbi:MAG: ABC transporter ATP-binding protein, partial [Candidatus Hydrogenedentes bacterium]|nr:ABC transporter ATP-binding protein [Candidatus Hydrogenedentota bacterium]
NDYFLAVQAQSREFFTKTPTGELLARASNDIAYVRELVGPGIMGTVDMLRLPLTLAVMIYYSARLTLIASTPLPFLSLLVYFFIDYMHKQSQRVQDQFGVVSTRAQENLAGARVVQAYGIADVEIAAFAKESEKYMRESIKLSVVMSFAWPVIGMAVGAVVLLVIGWGGGMVLDGATVSRPVWTGAGVTLQSVRFTLGDFTAFVTCLLMLAWPLAEFGWVMTLYQRGAVSMKRIAEYLARTPAIRDTESTDHSIGAVRGAIEFDRVRLEYDGRTALDDVSFSIAAGQTVAIVGPTGAGKTSIVSLLTREYDATSGVVRVDGANVRTIPLRVLRAGTAYVPQDTFLFSDTIRANLTFGRPDAPQGAIEYAADVAQLADTVDSFPARYETLLGERGVNLSGGQKQRLAIARAVVMDAPILVLDDALSSVDTHTEEQILHRLVEVMRGRTSIVISHRVSTVRDADLILVLRDGRIVERGAHDELLAMCGHYAEMHERQLLEDELETTA